MVLIVLFCGLKISNKSVDERGHFYCIKQRPHAPRVANRKRRRSSANYLIRGSKPVLRGAQLGAHYYLILVQFIVRLFYSPSNNINLFISHRYNTSILTIDMIAYSIKFCPNTEIKSNTWF